MKKIFIGLTIICATQFTYAQKSVHYAQPDRLFNQGREMFIDRNYAGTINTLTEFIKHSKDQQKVEDAKYMILGAEFYMGTPNILNEIKNYLEEYPGTLHNDKLNFYTGTIHFQNKEWDKALFWLSKSNGDLLEKDERGDYNYRMAYSLMQTGKSAEAKRLFSQLTNNKKYGEASSFYYAVINFKDGNYKESASVFRKLKDKSAYRENATFYLIQSSYLDGQYEETIREGRSFVANYPQNENKGEVYRLLANCYYKAGDMVNTVLNYERFMQSGAELFREDMFQLGNAYYQSNTYPQAADVLKVVASNNDLLGQAGYMLLGQTNVKLGNDANALMAFDAASRAQFDRKISEDALYNYVLLLNKGAVATFGQSIDACQRFLSEYPTSRHTDEINNLMANTLLSTKNYKMALQAIDRMKSPGRPVLEAKQVLLSQEGIQNCIDGNYSQALTNLNSAINMGNLNTQARNESYFWRGEANYRMASYHNAISDFSSYISNAGSSQSNYALALYNLGYSNFQLKNYAKAQDAFKKYVSAERDNTKPIYSDALNRIGDTYLNGRSFAEAERYYSQAANAAGGNADYAEFQKAFVKGMQRDYRGKITALDNMMYKYPNSVYYPDALMEKSKSLIMLNREKDAIPVLENLLTNYSRSAIAPEAGVQLGQSYYNINQAQKAIDTYKRVISNYPNTEEARLSIRSMEAVYKDLNDIQSYAAYMNSLGGNFSVSSIRQDSLTYLAAEALYLKGQQSQAKSAFAKYLQSYPNGVYSGDANFNLGSILFDANDKQAALNHFQEAIKSANPKYMDDALIYTSGIQFDNKDYAAAYETYKHLYEASNSNENKGIAQLGMLRCAYLTQQDNAVVDAANKILADGKVSDKVASEARFYRGQSLRNIGRVDDAIKDLTEVAKDTRSISGAESQYLLAQMYYDKRFLDLAEKQVNDFMKKGTPHEYWMARALIVLSDTYKAKGDNFQARQWLESLQANYKGTEPDIQESVSTRLAELGNN
ncbi:tetratricopeptide repeat protein [Dysgonomonas massiliensis]|uniref:tetratricopeptide repeat protein n=1 Tax=Dysgonomonas massiliensis TaxID=2040292 RepID=UPI000C76CB09|nr:tetratricopeptide repeat protein [Dysgonomonas massiliensis]